MPHDPNDPVVHINQPHDIYIGRPKANQPWNFGNPFIVGVDGSRGECIPKFRKWLETGDPQGSPRATPERRQWILQNIPNLKGKTLGCFCRPGKCHGDILVEMLNKISSPAPAPEPSILDKRMSLRQPGEIFDVTSLLNNPRPPVAVAMPGTISRKTDRPFTYAGIGSRDVPDPLMLDIMERLGSKGAKLGHVLRSGGAIGSDQAFERGARSVISDPMSPLLEIFFDKGFRGKDYTEDQLKLQNAYVNRFHPAPERLTPFTRRLHGRNTHQVLGLSGDDPVDLVIAYRNPAKTRSGTDQALRIAKHFNIPIVNLADRTVLPNPKELSPLIQLLKNLKFLK